MAEIGMKSMVGNDEGYIGSVRNKKEMKYAYK